MQVRRKEIRRQRARKSKLKQLREKFKKAKNESDRTAILAKLKRVSPTLSKEAFVAPIERESRAAR
jgi:hypothetical protein